MTRSEAKNRNRGDSGYMTGERFLCYSMGFVGSQWRERIAKFGRSGVGGIGRFVWTYCYWTKGLRDVLFGGRFQKGYGVEIIIISGFPHLWSVLILFWNYVREGIGNRPRYILTLALHKLL